jgi:uncharacterized membrane protein
MDVLAVVLLIVVIIMMLNHKGSLNNKIRDLDHKLFELRNLIEQLKLTRPPVEETRERVKKAEVTKPIVSEPPPVITAEPVLAPPVVEPEVKPKPLHPEEIERQLEVIEDSLSPIHRPIKTRDFEPAKPRERRPSFFERHPDLEKFIGENLINKIGIAILVLAIGFFVKYAIDNDWIGLVGRVGVGIVCGGILIAIAHWLRNSYKAFSSVLVGGGLAVFYFTITLAFQQFHLFSQITAFIILIVITVFAVALALLYDKQELAVIALVGGFASPFMVSNGSANYSGLLTYLLILNTGLLVMAYFKAWRVLNIVSFVFTVIVFSSVLYVLPPAAYRTGFVFASIFYVLFFAVNVANNVRENKKFIASDFTILLLNTGLYFSAGLYLLTVMHQEQFRGLFCVSLAVVNLVLSYILFRNRKVDTNILYLLIGITLTFISLAAPIQLHGHSITIFWASEAVLLYWLYQKSSIGLMKYTSLLLWIAMLLSLLMDWYQIYSNASATLTIIANKGFITTLCASVGSFLLAVLAAKDTPENKGGISVDKRVYSITGLILLFLSGLVEINHQFLNRFPYTDLNVLYMMVYTPVFVFIYYIVSFKIAVINFTENLKLGLLLTCIVVYLLLTPQFFDLQHVMLETGKVPASHFMVHWIGAVFVGLLLYRVIMLSRKSQSTGAVGLFTWGLSIVVVVFLSLEVSLTSNLLFYSRVNSIDRIETVYIKTGLPILWGLLSFSLMWLGMKYKQRMMRVASLTLFSLTLVKLFLFDIKNIPVWGKIVAFFCLGVLLLIVAFMYQRTAKKTADEEEAKKNE